MATMRARTGKDGVNSWNVYWPLGGRGSGGKTQSLTFDNEDDAIKAKEIADRAPRHSLTDAQVVTEVYRQELPVAIGKTVADIVDGYLDWLSEVDVGTRLTYRSMLHLYVLPAIGHVPVEAVKKDQIEKIMKRLEKCDCDKTTGKRGPVCSRRRLGRRDEAVNGGHTGGLSKRTRDRYYNLMKGLFTYAVEEEMRPDNPVKQYKYKTQNLSTYHSSRKEDVHFYMTKQQFKLLRSGFPEEYWPLLDFLVMTGARYSEATATKVRAIRNERGMWMLDIVDTWKQAEPANGRRSFIVEEPKHGSNRSFDIEPELVETLAPLRAGRKPTDLIFRVADGGRIEYDIFYDVWEKAVREATRCPDHMPEPEGKEIGLDDYKPAKCGTYGGLNAKGKPCGQWCKPGWDRCPDHCGIPPHVESTCDCTDPYNPKRLPRKTKIHDLRHSNAAWLIEAGVPIIEVSRRLGHSSVVVTETVYAGLIKTPESRERVSVALTLA